MNGLGAIYGIGTGVTGLSWDRKKEKEADYIGLMYMARAGYDPEEAIKVLDALDAESANAPAQSAFSSTHPSNPERIMQLRDAMPKAEAERAKSASVKSGPIVVR